MQCRLTKPNLVRVLPARDIILKWGRNSQSDDAEPQLAVPIGALSWFGLDGEEINKVEAKTTFTHTDDREEHLVTLVGRRGPNPT